MTSHSAGPAGVASTVIVAEKYPLARATLAALLSQDGYRVFQAESSRSALSLIEALPDLAVLLADLDMMGWRSMLSRTAARTGATIIAMEGAHPYSQIYDLRARGIAGCVQKPIVYAELRSLIKATEPRPAPGAQRPGAALGSSRAASAG